MAERKIEKLLRIVGDMRMLEEDHCEEKENKVIDLFGELDETDLDLIAAAVLAPTHEPLEDKSK